MKNKNRRPTILFENARIIFRNFSGKAGKFNNEGNRNFCLLLDTDVANDLARDNWNIKWLKPREDDEPPQAYTQVKVGYGGRPPKIVMISSRGKTNLDEDSINILDWAEIETIDLLLTPYEWEAKGATGVKGYVKTMFVTIREDELELKYANAPDSAASCLAGEDCEYEEED